VTAQPPNDTGLLAAEPEGPDRSEIIVAAVLAVPGVARMHGGMFGEVATYLPGRRVRGVQLHEDSAAVHVVLDWGVDIGFTADLVRSAVQQLVATPVDVTVEDLDDAETRDTT